MKKIYLAGLGLGICLVVALIAYISLIPNINAGRIERYEAIPEKPADFSAFTREIWGGGLTDLCELKEEYWKQPEFYGSAWENSKDRYYDNPDYRLWGVYGQGNLPREIGYTFTNFKKGDEFKVCSFFHNGFGVWTYQGFKLIPIENEYFEVEIINPEITVSPTFPVFEEGWVQKVEMIIRVKENPPAGSYELGFDVTEPSNEYAREKAKEVLYSQVDKQLYMKDCIDTLDDVERCQFLIDNREKKYVNGGSYKPQVRPFTLQVTINE